jgi:hypothetical protein
MLKCFFLRINIHLSVRKIPFAGEEPVLVRIIVTLGFRGLRR